ncbi:MAG: hypothetical protein KJN71_09730 [Acidimicrobiia bacterium]|nr:hypothetical protein [Acidimicrobiia bacterium]
MVTVVARPCATCGAMGDSPFCTSCGLRRDGRGTAAPTPTATTSASPTAPITFWIQLVAVAGIGAAIGIVGWDTLAVPTREITEWVTGTLSIDPTLTDPAACGVDDTLCYSRAAALSLIGVLAVAVALVLFRLPLMKLLRAVIGRLPAVTRPVLSAVLATAVFTMAYANIHTEPGLAADGVVPVDWFPALVGVTTFLVTAFASSPGGLARGVFRARDAIPTLIRILVVFGLPLATSQLLIGNLEWSAIAQEQFVILGSVLVGSMAFIPSIHRRAS